MKYIAHEELAHVHGGMRWEGFRRSTNIEDRRSPAAIRKENEWWTKNHGSSPSPEGK